MKFFGSSLVLKKQGNDAGNFTEEVLHLGISLGQFAFDFIFVFLVVWSLVLQHRVKLDSLLHVEDESSDSA